MDLHALPKIELHLHLDCSLSFEAVRKLDPQVDERTYLQDYMVPAKCDDLMHYIDRVDRCCQLMQDENALRVAVSDLYDQLKADNVIYAELRFAPYEHTSGGMTIHEVVDVVCDEARSCQEKTGIKGGIILCTLRNYSEQQGMDTVRLAERYLQRGVVGFDIASDEKGFPLDAHERPFAFAREKGIPCTAHAGEACGAESVWETLKKLRPSRIGHGVRSTEDVLLLKHLADKDIHLEVCPTSNIQTNVYDIFEHHQIDKIYSAGVSMSINTDARAVSGNTLESEYQKLQTYFGWDMDQFLKCNLEAIRHAFADAEVKEELRQRVLRGFNKSEKGQ